MQHDKAKHLRKVTPKEISDKCDHDYEKYSNTKKPTK